MIQFWELQCQALFHIQINAAVYQIVKNMLGDFRTPRNRLQGAKLHLITTVFEWCKNAIVQAHIKLFGTKHSVENTQIIKCWSEPIFQKQPQERDRSETEISRSNPANIVVNGMWPWLPTGAGPFPRGASEVHPAAWAKHCTPHGLINIYSLLNQWSIKSINDLLHLLITSIKTC